MVTSAVTSTSLGEVPPTCPRAPNILIRFAKTSKIQPSTFEKEVGQEPYRDEIVQESGTPLCFDDPHPARSSPVHAGGPWHPWPEENHGKPAKVPPRASLGPAARESAPHPTIQCRQSPGNLEIRGSETRCIGFLITRAKGLSHCRVTVDDDGW